MIQEKILEALRKKQDFLSGEDLSEHLKLSRQALWKHIQELREAGFEIIAVPHLGYQLVSIPDRLLPSEISSGLNTKFIGKKIYYFDTAESTMDIALGLGIKNSPEGTLVLSEAQSKGRGRLGRSWISPKYKGLYLSLILRPKISPNQSPLLTMLTAISICEVMKEFYALDAQIKWPNDILIHQKKVGGILTELNAEMDEIRFVVIGIGLNVNNDKKLLPPQATSLKEQKKENLNRVELLKNLLLKLEDNYISFIKEGSSGVIEKWREYNITLGKRIKVHYHKHYLEGQAQDIDSDGALLLRKDSGITQRITSGDVVHCR